MLQLTSSERAMRERLLAIAASHTPENVTYEELWLATTGEGFRESGAFNLVGRMLYHIAIYEQRLGRPMLTSLVVKASGLPGDGYFELAEQYGRDASDRREMWMEELESVREFWSRALDPSAVVRDRFGPMLAWDPTVLGDTRALATFEDLKRRV
ncbi:MAG: hypothetical protein KY469_06480 [Actinobacteria bacterium]|nr:hypothetical protein [Actinomycetota bacterium]